MPTVNAQKQGIFMNKVVIPAPENRMLEQLKL